MLDSVAYMRPLVVKNQGNACSSILARIFRTGSQTSMFAPEMQPEPYKAAPPGKILQILRVRNRFDKKMTNDDAPHWSGGFRDLAFKVKVGFKVPTVEGQRASNCCFSPPTLFMQESSSGAPQFVPVYDQLLAH